MKKLYVYADEASFMKGSQEILGTGIFISEFPVDDCVIIPAMKLLSEDPDFDNRMDSRTIKHGYFHASEDSKNAHSHFCKSIVIGCSGNFAYSYLSKKNRSDRSAESLYRLTLKLVASKFIDEPCDVEMTVERRPGFGEGSVSKFLENLNKEYALMANSLPSIINVFSKITITIADKTHPGLQVVDFLLWSTNRANMNPINEIWKNRLNLRLNEFLKSEDEDQISGTYYLGKSAFNYDNLYKVRIKYPFTVPKNIPNDGNILDYYSYIENTIRHFSMEEIPQHAMHWIDAIKKSHEIIKCRELDEASLKFICRTFIYIFDTIPVYRELAENDEQAWLEILFTKRLAGIMIANGGIHNGRTRNSILRWKWEQKNLKML